MCKGKEVAVLSVGGTPYGVYLTSESLLKAIASLEEEDKEDCSVFYDTLA